MDGVLLRLESHLNGRERVLRYAVVSQTEAQVPEDEDIKDSTVVHKDVLQVKVATLGVVEAECVTVIQALVIYLYSAELVM